eukprot:7172292-Prorocentrum_lima.AAC.1
MASNKGVPLLHPSLQFSTPSSCRLSGNSPLVKRPPRASFPYTLLSFSQTTTLRPAPLILSLIHISKPTRLDVI